MLKLDTGSEQLTEFVILSNEYKEVAQSTGITYWAPPPNISEVFAALPADTQNNVLSKLRFYIDVAKTARKNNWSAMQEHKLTWYAIGRLNLKPPHDLFSMITPLDCVEIYDASGVQMYRSFNFCSYCSYSLEELLIYPWTDLYERNDAVMGQMYGVAGRALTAAKEPFKPDIPSHVGVELRSARKREVAVSFSYVSPLFCATGETAAFLATSRLEVLVERDNSKRLEKPKEKSVGLSLV